MPEDRSTYLASGDRLRIAVACRDEPLTKEEIAARLNRPSGGLSAPQTMKRKGVLLIEQYRAGAGKRPDSPLFSLNPDWLDDVNEAEAGQAVGTLVAHTDIILIPTANAHRAYAVLARGDLPYEWGANLHGEQMGLALFPSRGKDGMAAARLLGALNDAGVQPVRLHLGHVMGRNDLRDWARAVIGSSAGPVLTDGG